MSTFIQGMAGDPLSLPPEYQDLVIKINSDPDQEVVNITEETENKGDEKSCLLRYFLSVKFRWRRKLPQFHHHLSLLSSHLSSLPDGHLGGGQSQENHQENLASEIQILPLDKVVLYIYIHLFILKKTKFITKTNNLFL